MAQNQAYLFLVFSLTGVAIGVIFDFFRIIRRNIKTSNIITYIQDIIFWILTGILVLYNIWYFNNGELRIYVFLGIIMGVLIYITTLSELVIKVFSKIISLIIKFIRIPIEFIISISRKIFVNFTKKERIKKGNFVKNGE